MNALLVLIPVSLLLIAGAVSIFFWAVRHDQFRNLDTPGIVPLLDASEGAGSGSSPPSQPKEVSP